MQHLLSVPENVHEFTRVYRVDLNQHRWCVGARSATSPLPKVTDTLIVFQLEEHGQMNDTVAFANRESGKFIYRVRLGEIADLWSGQ